MHCSPRRKPPINTVPRATPPMNTELAAQGSTSIPGARAFPSTLGRTVDPPRWGGGPVFIGGGAAGFRVHLWFFALEVRRSQAAAVDPDSAVGTIRAGVENIGPRRAGGSGGCAAAQGSTGGPWGTTLRGGGGPTRLRHR